MAPWTRSIALFISSLEGDIICRNLFIMGKIHEKVHIFPSTTRGGTTLNTSPALDSPSVMSKLLTPPHTHTATSTESETASDDFDDASTVLDKSGSLGPFLETTIARAKQIE